MARSESRSVPDPSADITRLIGAYAHAVDARDFEAVAALFAPTGVLSTPGWRAQGPADILARLSNRAAKLSGGPKLVRHHVSSLFIEPLGATSACGRAYYLAMTDAGPDHAGAYIDRYVRIDGCWLFEARDVLLDWFSPHSKLAAAASRPPPHAANRVV